MGASRGQRFKDSLIFSPPEAFSFIFRVVGFGPAFGPLQRRHDKDEEK